MYHIATHNIGLRSYYDDFNRLMKDHFVKGIFTKYDNLLNFGKIRDRTTRKYIEKH